MKNFYAKNISPNLSTITIVGNISEDDAVSDFQSLEMKWERKKSNSKIIPSTPPKSQVASLYFVDFPDAKQSVIMIGNLAFIYR